MAASWLAYLAAALRENGHSVQILDRDLIHAKINLIMINRRETLGLINDFNSKVVGFSVTTPNVTDANVFSGKVKRIIHQLSL